MNVLHHMCLAGMLLLSWISAPSQPTTEAWVRRYNSPEASSRDYARKVVTDRDGNVIVAGDSDDGFTGADILVVKYSGSGIALWTNRYNGPANGDDRGYAVGVDQIGNVFVTGSSISLSSNANYTTLAYSRAGVPLWTNHYNGLANGEDEARALGVDHNGNVFVTGYSTGDQVSRAYLTIGYSGAGVPLWTNRYGGSSGEAHALAVDGNGNVFVTGSSGGEYGTVGYSGAGIPLWTNRYNVPGGTDSATAIAVDNAGTVFVTGSSYGIGSFYNDHYSTLAYSASGMPLWTNHYNGPGIEDFATALAVDHQGNVFVTGYSYSAVSSNRYNTEYATIAYSGAGVALWTNRYAALGGLGRPYAIAVDHSGDVLVTGTSANDYATIKYSGAGVALWTNRYDGPANSADGANDVSIDHHGNIFVTGHSRADYATIAYTGAGVALWTNRYDGPLNSDDNAAAIAVHHRTGNIAVTGSSSAGSNSDYVTIAYSEAGVALWTNRYNGPANAEDGASSVVVDGRGNVIVTGGSRGEASLEYATIAYSAAGVALWTNRYSGPDNFHNYPSAVAVDAGGTVFVTGHSYDYQSDYDYTTIAYSAAGVALWTNHYNGPGNDTDYAYAMAVNNRGSIFVTGYSFGSDTYVDFATLAYSRTGVPLWTNRYSGPAENFDRASAIAVDDRGHVFVTGYSSGSGSGLDYATLAYSEAGVALWTNRYNGLANGEDGARAIAVDNNGNVFITGYSTATAGSSDYVTIAYSYAGVPLWTNRYNGTGNATDRAEAVGVDSSGNVLVTGYSIGPGSDYDFATIAYSASGIPLWTNRYNGPANGTDQPGLGYWASKSLAIGPKDEVYVTGGSDGNYGGASISDYVTIKYVWRPYLAIQPLAAGSSTVKLNVSAPPNSSWSVQRSPTITGPWTNLGLTLSGTNGSSTFQDANPPAGGAFYRATQP